MLSLRLLSNWRNDEDEESVDEMSKSTRVSLDFECYRLGLCTASICTSLPIEEAVERMNQENPTGINSPWSLSDSTFQGGEPNPSPCNESPETHKHYLLEC